MWNGEWVIEKVRADRKRTPSAVLNGYSLCVDRTSSIDLTAFEDLY